MALSLQPSTGDFLFMAPDLGLIRGVVATSISGATIQLGATRSADQLIGGRSQPVPVAIAGTVSPSSHSADVHVHVAAGGDHHLVTAKPVPAAAAALVTQLMSWYRSGDDSSIAGALAPELIHGMDRGQVSSQLASEALTVTEAAVSGPGSMSWLPNGRPEWTQPVHLVATSSGGQPVAIDHVHLVFEQGRWWEWVDNSGAT